MTAPEKTLWPIDAHTIAKHEILKKYLEAWFPILSRFPRLVYVDGFCGPGKYEGGEPGSPIIALEVAKQHSSRLSRCIDFYFIDEREDRLKHLESEIPSLPPEIKYEIKHGKFEEQFEPILKQLERSQNSALPNLIPSFVFIDPFGFSDAPFSIVKRILKLKGGEVLINFMNSYINRFINHPYDSIPNHIVKLYGTEKCLNIPSDEVNRYQALRTLYQDQLKAHAKFVRLFEMRDKRDNPIYDLFFASNNPKGFIKMKEAMWKVDETGVFSFSDATNPFQTTLFGNLFLPDVIKAIQNKFSGRGKVRCKVVTEYIECETAFLGKHMREALNSMEGENKIVVEQLKSDGKKRRAKSFPDDAILSFL